MNGDCAVDLGDLVILVSEWVGSGHYLPAGRSGSWDFEEGMGSATAVDSSGNGRHGVLRNMDSDDRVTGRFGNALEFDGVDDYVEVVGWKGVPAGGARTIVAWLKIDSTADLSRTIVSWGNDSAGGAWQVMLDKSGRGYPGAVRVAVVGGTITGRRDLRDGDWHSVAVVIEDDGSPDVSETVIYVDGVSEDIGYVAGHPINTGDTSGGLETNDVRIGAFYRPGTEMHFEGAIDSVVVYDRALSQQEIASIGVVKSDMNVDGSVDAGDFSIMAGDWLMDLSGSIQVTISPAEAVADGGQWRLAGGDWQDSGQMLARAPEGSHLLEFRNVDGWVSPDSRMVTIRAAQVTSADAEYTEIPDSGLIISEFMAVNSHVSSLVSSLNLYTRVNGHPDPVYPDWIEIYNADSKAISLEGWYLTDDPEDLTKWRFPAGYSVATGNRFVVYASTKTVEVYPNNYPFVDDLGSLHTNFALAADGGYVALVEPDGQSIAHEYTDYPSQRGLYTYGLADDGYGYLKAPTRASANSERFFGVVADTKFSADRGFYDDPFSVEITTETPEATIRYTTDGSDPTMTNGKTYVAPVTINTTTCLRAAAFKDDYLATNADAQTYIFLEDVIRQPPNPPGFPTSWGSPYDYEMDPEVVDNSLYSGTIKDDLKSIPTMSIVTNVNYMFGSSGIYANTNSSGINWERPCSVEFFEADGSGEFQVNCGVRIYGGVGRNSQFEKHTFRLLFKGGYGPSKLNFPLFGKDAVDSFDTIILRAGFNNSWHRHNSGEENRAQFIRDEWIRQAQLDMGRAGLHGTFVHLYVNGLYWGLYNPVERGNADFGATYFGGEKEEWDAVNSYPRNVVDGFADSWVAAQNIASSGVADAQGYAALAEYVDIPNLIDYMLVNFYGGNRDWDNHNWYAVRRRMDGAGWKLLGWDSERILESISGDNRTGVGEFNKPSYLYSRLRQNPEFKLQFADHAHRHLFNDGELTPAKAAARYEYWADFIDRAIVGESARWGDSSRSTPYTRDAEWVTERNRLLEQYFPQRTSYTLGFIKNAGLYPANTDAPVFNINGSYQHGGHVEIGDVLTITNPTPNGSERIYYTLDGTDPRVPSIPGPDTSITIVSEDALKRVLVPTQNIGTNWRGGNEPFDDSGWNAGSPVTPGRTGGVGYDRNTTYNPYMSYDVKTEMENKVTSCYIRIPFDVDLAAIDDRQGMELRVRYDDGFVAYLNGHLVESRNINDHQAVVWNDNADTQNADSSAQVFEPFNISEHRDKLTNGENILAIHGLNLSLGSSDFLISVELAVKQDLSVGGGGVSANAREFIEGVDSIVLTGTRHVKSRILGAEWSALNEAVYSVGPVNENICISEIMYHPQDPPQGSQFGDEDFEFVELTNIGDEPLDLTLVRLTNGVDFVFPAYPPVAVAGGEYVLVVKNRAAFETRYPGLTELIVGEYTGSLANDGEKIELVDALGEAIEDFKYNDGWYEITDGLGFSLTVRDPAVGGPDHFDVGLAGQWRLDETAGSTAADSSGTGLHGTVAGSATWRPGAGKIDGALEFDGLDSRVKIDGYKGILASAGRTCTAWIKSDATGNDRMTIVSWGNDNPGGAWHITLDRAAGIHPGSLRLAVIGGRTAGTTNLCDNKWHHVAVVVPDDGTADVSEAILYVDGKAEAISGTVPRSINTGDTTGGLGSNDVLIGVFFRAGTELPFKGMIDNLCIYDRPLSKAEIELLADEHKYRSTKEYWRPSAAVDGSPGRDDSGDIPAPPGSVIINEVLAHSDLSPLDWIELHNTTDSDIYIGDWFISDNDLNFKKFQIPAGTWLPADGYVVFTEDQFNTAGAPGCLEPFALSENGEKLYLHSGQADMITGYAEERRFGPSDPDVSMGLYIIPSTGEDDFVAMAEITEGTPNSYPKVGPIVISEIMYHPAIEGDAEYIELLNIGTESETLYKSARSEAWHVEGINDFQVLDNGQPVTMNPGERILLVRDIALFGVEFTADPSVKLVLEWQNGSLQNGGENIELVKPGDYDTDSVLQYIVVDSADYSDGAHPENGRPDLWPTEPDGGIDTNGDGVEDKSIALQRTPENAYGDDPLSWTSADPTPGG